MATEIFELIQEIRTHISRTEKMASLLPDSRKWLPLTSALDVIEDVQEAVEYYIESDYPDDIGGKYLHTYGLLQAMFVQMDAANSVHKALIGSEVNFKKDYPGAYDIREMRNDVVGHPTNRENQYSIYLVRNSLHKDGFYYIKDDSRAEKGKGESIPVPINKAIEDVRNCIKAVLRTAIAALDKEFAEYISLHRDRKMRDIFKLLDYAREKATSEELYFSDWGYNAAKEMAAKCEEEVIRRYGSVEAVDSYNYLLIDIHEICDLIEHGVPSMPLEWGNTAKKYLLECFFCKLEELEACAEETDQYFETFGKGKA